MLTMTPEQLARWALDHGTNDAWIICQRGKKLDIKNPEAVTSEFLAIIVKQEETLVVMHNDHREFEIPAKVRVAATLDGKGKKFKDGGGALIFLGVIAFVLGALMNVTGTSAVEVITGAIGMVVAAVLVSVGELVRTVGRAVRELQQ